MHICCYGKKDVEIRQDTTIINVQGTEMLKVCQWEGKKCVDTHYYLADAPFEHVETLAEPYTDYHAMSQQYEWFISRPSNKASLTCVIVEVIKTCLSKSSLKKLENPARAYIMSVSYNVTAKGDVTSVGLGFSDNAPDVLTDEEKVMIMKGIMVEKFNFCDFPKATANCVCGAIIFYNKICYRKKQFYKDLLLK
jgi:hypothetical protein